MPTNKPAAQRSRRSRARVRVPVPNPELTRLGRERPVGADGKSTVTLIEDEHTDEQIEKYLLAVADGGELDVVARSIGSTATRMSALRRRDPDFDGRVSDAIESGVVTYQDRLRATARTRATKLEGGSDRILEVELATHVPGYEHLRRDRVRHEGTVEHKWSIPVDVIEQLETREEVLVMLALVERMGGEVVDATGRELGPGE